MAHPTSLAFVLAGGKGERLFPLTAMRSKPSVPFGGRYRIVDFALSNLINSRIYSIYLLVQYKSQSLIEHVRHNWVLSSVMREHFVAVVPPQMRMGPEWFQGTADAVFQNLAFINQLNPELVIIFGADHVYRMDIRQMIDFHLAKNADITVAARPVPLREASSFGVIVADAGQRIISFQEKPKEPKPMATDPGRAYVSMGNYIFSRDFLTRALVEAQAKRQHDFGTHILPASLDKGRVFAYDFSSNVIPDMKPYEETGYWRDVGTIRSYYDAHMDMLGPEPRFDSFNNFWPIHPAFYEGPATKILSGEITNSVIADGCMIESATIRNSFIRSGVRIEPGVTIDDCIIMDRCVIKRGARLKNAVIDKMNLIEKDETIGYDPDRDRFRCHIDASGIAVLPRQGRKEVPAY
ncbi:MAG: glucose-1-phosphate adenylyltransferase [Nitrospiraceae bacterium]|nr:glucose-1-phosphate adenylyltransferase [Nitrospiraceae bacterium]